MRSIFSSASELFIDLEAARSATGARGRAHCQAQGGSPPRPGRGPRPLRQGAAAAQRAGVALPGHAAATQPPPSAAAGLWSASVAIWPLLRPPRAPSALLRPSARRPAEPLARRACAASSPPWAALPELARGRRHPPLLSQNGYGCIHH